MTTDDSYYDRLGVPPTASTEAIKTAYRRLARQVHPDVDPSEAAAARFARISEAYATLSDPRKRLSYNQSVLASASSSPSAPVGLTRHELRAAWERVIAYLMTGALLGGALLGAARWLGGTADPWLASVLIPTALTGAGLGLLWGIDANFVLGDFVGSGALWLLRGVRFAGWIVGLSWLAQQSLAAANLGSGPLAATISRDVIGGAAALGLLIAVVATLRDH